MKLLVVNGPNLDRLGTRQPEVYGTATLPDVLADIRSRAGAATIEAVQSADPKALIAAIEGTDADAIIINPASLTHHSRPLREALARYPGPVVEVHISNIASREPFRRRSMIAGVATGSIVGLGVQGYLLAVDAAIRLVEQDHPR